jgi:hypothetical protein
MGNYRSIKRSSSALLTALCLAAAATIAIGVAVETLQAQSGRTTVTKRPPLSACAKATGIFMGWGKGRFNTETVVAIKFVPAGRSTKALMNAPSITPTKRYRISRDSIDLRVARRLKIGTPVVLHYLSRNGWVWINQMRRAGEPLGPSSSEVTKSENECPDTMQTPIDKFVFIGAKKVKTSGGLQMSIVARRGSNMWSFEAPFESTVGGVPVLNAEIDAKDNKRSNKRSKKKKSRPDPDETDTDAPDQGEPNPETLKPLSVQLSKFKAGDIVAVKYKTNTDDLNFKFILTGICPYRLSATGAVTRIGTRVIRGKKHDVAYVRSGKLKHVLVVPLKSRPGAKTDATTLAATLKSLGESEATFTYCKLGGIMWIDNIEPK